MYITRISLTYATGNSNREKEITLIRYKNYYIIKTIYIFRPLAFAFFSSLGKSSHYIIYVRCFYIYIRYPEYNIEYDKHDQAQAQIYNCRQSAHIHTHLILLLYAEGSMSHLKPLGLLHYD